MVLGDNVRMSSNFGLATLDILNVTPTEAGNYMCQLANEVGIVESTATVLVQREHFHLIMTMEGGERFILE